ncbi:hypothetical protein [Myxococcus stipitatus]|uniref:hypothetical protein n=1 Tax=Myxococcus stipitatus TaxID=83455 RepID=UPI0030D1D9FC
MSAQYFWEELQKGAIHFHEQGSAQGPKGRVRQFFHGLSLPLHIARVLLADPVARRQYVRVGLLQTVAALALALSCMGSAKKAASAADSPISEEDIVAEVQEALREAGIEEPAVQVRKDSKAEREQHDFDAAKEAESQQRSRDFDAAKESEQGPGVAQTAKDSETGHGARDAQATKDSETGPGARDAQAARNVATEELRRGLQTAREEMRRGLQTARNAATEEMRRELQAEKNAEAEQIRSAIQAAKDAEFERRLRDVEAAAEGADGGPSLPAALMALATTAAANSGPGNITVTRQDDGTMKVDRAPSPPAARTRRGEKEKPGSSETEDLTYRGFSLTAISFWLALLGSLQIAQWVIIALSRDYHDAISREAALLTRVEPDDSDLKPRIRVNVEWLRKKVRRRVRAMILFAAGVPAALLLSLPFRWVGVGNEVFTGLTTLWGMWWLLVFTAAKSGQAWEAREGQRPPWFIRAWTWVTTHVPGLRWGLLKSYGAMWSRRTQEVYEPVATVERHPWAYAGLALARFIGSFAPLRFFVRPLIPVASAHILREERTKLGLTRSNGDGAPRPAGASPMGDSL